jgi:hypothetical protein
MMSVECVNDEKGLPLASPQMESTEAADVLFCFYQAAIFF